VFAFWRRVLAVQVHTHARGGGRAALSLLGRFLVTVYLGLSSVCNRLLIGLSSVSHRSLMVHHLSLIAVSLIDISLLSHRYLIGL